MTKEESSLLLDRIAAAMKLAVAEVYEDARKNGTKLVISRSPGEVQWIRVLEDGTIENCEK